jgi:hypothetical protein
MDAVAEELDLRLAPEPEEETHVAACRTSVHNSIDDCHRVEEGVKSSHHNLLGSLPCCKVGK